jgi:Fe-S-cluster-containing dehydrogenase component/anaerobic selenocysteine-containing dehydrogenase
MASDEMRFGPGLSRRDFLQMMAGSGAAYALGSERLLDKLAPEVKGPGTMKPGLWTEFATTCRECPAGCGMLIRCQDNRIVKAEGSREHPVSSGGLCPRGQSSVQGQYDPDRLDHFLRADEPREKCRCRWKDFISAIAAQARQASRVVIVSDVQRGALSEVMEEFAGSCGRPTRVLYYEALSHEAARHANQKLFGSSTLPRYRFDESDNILSFGADFLETWTSSVEYASQFAAMHHQGADVGGQLVYIGPRLSVTAANADEFYKVRPSEMKGIALAMVNAILAGGWARKADADVARAVAPFTPDKAARGGMTAESIVACARRFAGAGKALAVAGQAADTSRDSEELAMAAMLLNYVTGNIGKTVDFAGGHVTGRACDHGEMAVVLAELQAGDVVIFHNTNPVFTLPQVAADIRKTKYSVYIGTLKDETAEQCFWILPMDAPLESWGDHEPWSGTRCLMQPAMSRLYDTRNSGDMFIDIAREMGSPLKRKGQDVPDFLAWLRLRWKEIGQAVAPDRTPDAFWRESLRRGYVTDDSLPARELHLKVEVPEFHEEVRDGKPELWLWPSILLHDGRVGNRGWLQEAADPISTIAWQSWLDLPPALAGQIGVSDGDIVKVSNSAGAVELPVRVSDDIATGCAAMALGRGHTAMGEVARGIGANGFALLGGKGGVQIAGTGRREELLSLCATRKQYDREILQWTVCGETQGKKEDIIWPLPKGYDKTRDVYAAHEHKNHRWAMVVDLDRCIGCGACGVACYAENNIHVVGAKRAASGRVMPWLRVVPYEDQHEPQRIGFLPMLCQHCDAAPCEPVCPVYASIHNEEGLNAQVYNRCIGTRYCSNNCPYKVRRFNWFDYEWKPPLHMQLNPDVTARRRGVMEKCTFCVQRILYARHTATLEGRPLRDGEVQPACIQSCPTRTFVFGDLLDPKSQVSRLFEDERRYQVLMDLNTKPAVLYLKRRKPGAGRQV